MAERNACLSNIRTFPEGIVIKQCGADLGIDIQTSERAENQILPCAELRYVQRPVRIALGGKKLVNK